MGQGKLEFRENPERVERIINVWHEWQNAAARQSSGTSSLSGQPPRVNAEGQLVLGDESDVMHFLVQGDDCYYIDSQERGSRQRFWMFWQFVDAEKYLLVLISQAMRPGPFSASPIFRWYRLGVDPRVTLAKPDPDNFPGRVSLTVDDEPAPRGWMGETDAISFSHAIVLTFEELDRELREGVPSDWFIPL